MERRQKETRGRGEAEKEILGIYDTRFSDICRLLNGKELVAPLHIRTGNKMQRCCVGRMFGSAQGKCSDPLASHEFNM